MPTIEERVLAELGSGANPHFIIAKLEKNDQELLAWFQTWVTDLRPVINEAQQVEASGDRHTLELGLRIIEGNLRTGLFLLHELQARTKI